MKKAKRLIAVLMAALMIMSAAFLPAYAKLLPANRYTVPKVASNQKFYFSPDQGAGWLLDMVDELLAEENMKLNLLDLTGVGETIFKIAGVDLGDIDWTLDLTSVDNLIYTLDFALAELDGAWLGSLASGLGLLGDLLKSDGLDGAHNTLNSEIKRGNRSNNYQGGSNDLDVLYMLINWIQVELRTMLVKVIAGTFDWGVLESALPSMILDLPGFLKLTVYQLLVDSEASELPTDTTTPIDDGLQKVINWLLITGTSAENGGMTSMVGPDAEPLMPALGDQPGGADIKGTSIQVDRDGDGVLETKTMSFYQLVSNLIQALLDGMLAPMLGDLIADLVGVEITEQYPEGDPAILQDMMFNTILGAVESLAVQNGAPAPTYTDADNATPMAKINALMDWFFTGGGLDTFIKIDFYGIAITDNFMSLLGDLARLAINLLPGLIGGDMFEGASEIAYTADELNVVRYYKENSSGYYVTCNEEDEGAIDQTYVTYEAGEIVYAVEWDEATETPTAYNYLSNSQPVNTTDSTASDYRNISLIRPNYAITTNQVYACLIKMLLNGLIEGCYWPEWTTDIPTVLAYAMAALAAPTVPEGNYFARLDAYHQTGGIAPISDSNGVSVEPIPYYTIKNGVEVPTGALQIGASVAAFYINAIFTFDDAERLTEDGTSLEQFVTEFLCWAADEYLPMLIGNYNPATGSFTDGSGSETGPIWGTAFNNLIDAVYSDFATRTVVAEADGGPNWDAIYTFLDNTILTLIPSDWLPDTINSSFDLFNGWLLNNLLHFDLQGIISLFSVNKDESAELHQPVLTIILRIIDRVLGLVFNGTPLLLPVSDSRRGASASGVANIFVNHTDITSLDALLGGSGDESGSLPTLVGQLLDLLNTYKEELLTTLLPIIMGGTYNKPYDKEFDAAGNVSDSDWLTGSNYHLDTQDAPDMTTFKLWELQWYVDHFRTDVNAVRGITYDTEAEAEAAITDEDLQYIKAEGTGEFDAEGNEVCKYTVYTSNEFYISATETAQSEAAPDDPTIVTNYTTFSGFKYSHLDYRNIDRPWVQYDGDYRFVAVEDWKTTPYAYHNLKGALDDAEQYIGTYTSFAENSLGEAYNEWQRYFILTRLYSADLLDTNGDGRAVISTSDLDYVAATTDSDGNVTDPGFPVDDMPSVPTAMLPYSTTDGTTYSGYTYLDQTIDDYATLVPLEYTRANFEQLDMALKLGEDVTKNIVLPEAQAEEVVRLAINSRSFDITMDGNGAYDAGSIQWAGLNQTQLDSITNLCNELKYKFTYDVAAGTYEISRPVFRLIDGSYALGCGVDANPPLNLSYADADTITYAQENDDQMYKSYVEYMSTMTANRKTLYNTIDYISDRAEAAASLRTNDKIDTTMLKWALTLPEISNAYRNKESNLLNWKVTGIKDDGTYYYTKAYTQTTYDEFCRAYNYADCLNQASTGAIQSAGLTQSMVTAALQALLSAYNKLVEYTGDADWTQLDEYIAFAKGVYEDPNKFDEELGYSVESYNNLIAEWEAAKLIREDTTIDCERQQDVDAAAAALLAAINNLVYNSVPKILPSVDSVFTETTSATGANRTQGYVFGLVEGQGITLDLVDVIGMRIDEGIGNAVTVEDSGKGTGTGAYYKGTIGNLEKFRFYAVLYGDLNGDTRIDGTDRTALDLFILQGTNNSAEPSSGGMGAIKFEAGDANHDGVVDANDSLCIEHHYNYSDDEDYKILQNKNEVVAA